MPPLQFCGIAGRGVKFDHRYRVGGRTRRLNQGVGRRRDGRPGKEPFMVTMVSSGSAGLKGNLQGPALTENLAMNQPKPTASRREFLLPRSNGFPRRRQRPVHLHIRPFSIRSAVAIPAFFMALAGYTPLLLGSVAGLRSSRAAGSRQNSKLLVGSGHGGKRRVKAS